MRTITFIFLNCLLTASCLANSYAKGILFFPEDEFRKIKIVSVTNRLPPVGEFYPAKVKTIQEFFDRGTQPFIRDVEELKEKDKNLYEAYSRDSMNKDASLFFATGIFVTKDYNIFRFQMLSDTLLMVSQGETASSCIIQLKDPKFIRIKGFPKDSEDILIQPRPAKL